MAYAHEGTGSDTAGDSGRKMYESHCRGTGCASLDGPAGDYLHGLLPLLSKNKRLHPFPEPIEDEPSSVMVLFLEEPIHGLL